jgi:hypothetical protein
MKGTMRTSGHYDTLSDDTNFANLVTHAPVVKYFCHIGRHADAAVLA